MTSESNTLTKPSEVETRRRKVLVRIIVLLSLTQVVTLGILAHLLIRQAAEPETIVAIGHDDRFVASLAEKFNLSPAIGRYDVVINAIERYKVSHGVYPPDLKSLVPHYLVEIPGVYIPSGEKIQYEANPEQPDGPPFTFSILGHYPPPDFQSWELQYCPVELLACGENSEEGGYDNATRINYRWIWIGGSQIHKLGDR
jgi:hypothetical protein